MNTIEPAKYFTQVHQGSKKNKPNQLYLIAKLNLTHSNLGNIITNKKD